MIKKIFTIASVALFFTAIAVYAYEALTRNTINDIQLPKEIKLDSSRPEPAPTKSNRKRYHYPLHVDRYY